MSWVDVLGRKFTLALSRYIVCESADIKLCPYQVMITNILFVETNEQRIFCKVFTINEVLNFLYNLQWKKSFNGKFLLGNV